MQTTLLEFMPEVFSRSEILIWNFKEINDLDKNKDIKEYMTHQDSLGLDPRDAFHRQEFNNKVLNSSQSRYLVGRYLEDRADILAGSHIAEEGRTYHLAVDIFTRNQETVFAPCDGIVVRSSKESGLHNYGNYIIFQPADKEIPYMFFGHLADNKHTVGKVMAGETLGQLGSYENTENGGWSIHLHLQILTELPAPGEAPIGYTSLAELPSNKIRFPDPLQFFREWQIKR